MTIDERIFVVRRDLGVLIFWLLFRLLATYHMTTLTEWLATPNQMQASKMSCSTRV